MIEITGISAFIQYFQNAVEIDPELKQIQDTISESVLDRSNSLVPVDTGELRNSGHIVKSKDGNNIIYDAPHSLVVHEDLSVTDKNGQAKFLEKAMSEYESEAKKMLEDLLKGE